MIAAAADSPQPDVGEFVDTTLGLLVQLWPLWVLAAIIYVARMVLEDRGRRKRRSKNVRRRSASTTPRRPRRSRRATRVPNVPTVTTAALPGSIGEIDAMSGAQFERRLVPIFRQHGYSVLHTGSLEDFGADLVVEKEGSRTVVQAKRWSNEVGMRAVREALAAKAMYDCTEAMVVTSSTFTWRAQKLAAGNGVVLWDRHHLISLLETAATQATSGASIQNSVDDERFCARCGEEVSDRVRAYCREHPDRFGGLVYCFEHQKEFKQRLDRDPLKDAPPARDVPGLPDRMRFLLAIVAVAIGVAAIVFGGYDDSPGLQGLGVLIVVAAVVVCVRGRRGR